MASPSFPRMPWMACWHYRRPARQRPWARCARVTSQTTSRAPAGPTGACTTAPAHSASTPSALRAKRAALARG
eukprot:3796024-Pyramimonas_sp.AAC.1